MGIIHQQHSDTFELCSLDDVDVDTDSGRQRGRRRKSFG